ncbi:3'-5' exonuclease [Mesorhizobium sp.]|uniref:3'-5' exonuclease n=1 Tax=Mesorhizobium sp. TaxID=1871066 RepID=UPI0025DE94AB|nr:3'-5' exonuclease [Mesorhizobium sp.]
MNLEDALSIIDAAENFRVLRRLPSPPESRDLLGDDRFVGVVVDVETTGLDHDIDEVIELGMLKFEFDRNGRIGPDISIFKAFNEPSFAIPKSITELTGISDDDVRGHRVLTNDIDEFVFGASLVVAHNAAFDRPFLESISPTFISLPWACSATEIDWRSEGLTGSRLEYVAMAFGTFYDAHRAVDDCNALGNVLMFDLPRSKERVLATLLKAARRVQARICAVGAPYDLRVPLKRAGYRWNDGTNGFPRAWWKDVAPDLVEAETEFLRAFGPELISPTLFKMTARTRFRRAPPPLAR